MQGLILVQKVDNLLILKVLGEKSLWGQLKDIFIKPIVQNPCSMGVRALAVPLGSNLENQSFERICLWGYLTASRHQAIAFGFKFKVTEYKG